jgi:Xaa-Pro dipeptidase
VIFEQRSVLYYVSSGVDCSNLTRGLQRESKLIRQMSPAVFQSELHSRNGRPTFSNEEMTSRHVRLRQIMAEQQLTVLIVAGSTSLTQTEIHYLTNWQPFMESYLIVPAVGDPILLVRLWNHITDAEELSFVQDIRYGGHTGIDQLQMLGTILAASRYDGTRIGMLGPIRYQEFEKLKAHLPMATWVDMQGAYRRLRMVKTAEELQFVRIASEMNDKAVVAMRDNIVAGMRECDIARVIENTYLADRGNNLVHFTLSTSMAAPDRCVPHQYPPDRVIQKGDCIVTEISTHFNYYTGQILRSFTVGGPPTPLYQDLYDVGNAFHEKASAALRAGVSVGTLLDHAQLIHDAGFDIWDDLMHGIVGGYLPPIIRMRSNGGASESDEFQLPEDACLVIQPNIITRDAKAGIQIGNCFHVERDGAELMQRYPMDFIRCG